MSILSLRRRTAPVLAALAGVFLSACGGNDRTVTAHPSTAEARRQALGSEGDASNALDSLMRSCLAHHVGQGMSPQQALRHCVTVSTRQLADGLAQPMAESVVRLAKTFVPASVSANCKAGDPALSTDPWAGYSDEELSAEMEYAKSQRNEAAAAGDKAGETAWHEAAMELFYELEWRVHEGQPDGGAEPWFWGDANKPQRAQRTSGQSTCALVVDQAVQLLMECSRVGWKSPSCDVLSSRLQGCPDPRLAYVDPELGALACRQPVDPELVRQAWELECQKLTHGDVCGLQKTPDGSTPAYPYESTADLCRSPLARQEGEGCFAELPTPELNVPGVSDIVLFAWPKFGGPPIVLGGPKPLPCKVC